MKKIICFSLTILILVIMAFTFAGCSKNCDCKLQIITFYSDYEENIKGQDKANKWLLENDVEIIDIDHGDSNSSVMIVYIDHSCGK